MTISNGVTNLTRGVYVAVFAAALLFSSNVGVAFAALNNPVVTPDTFSIPENSVNGTVVGTVVATDPEPFTYAITAGNTGGAFAINSATGEITVNATAALDFEVTPSFALTVTATDSEPLAGSATITINLSNVNDVAPVADADAFSTYVNVVLNAPVTGVLDGDSDVEGGVITATPAAGSTTGGGTYTLLADGSFTYTPATDFSGPDTFTYTATDGLLTSAPATVTITVNKLAQTITFADPADQTYGNATSIVLAPTASSLLPVTLNTSGDCSVVGFTVSFTNAGSCTVTASQSGDAIYAAASSVDQTFLINPRAITVTATAANKIYDTNTTSAGVPTLSAGTLASGDLAVYTQAYGDEDVANGITLTPLATINGNGANPNYAITYVTALGDITQAPLTATAVAANKVYDGLTTTTAVVSVVGLGGDDVSATYTTADFDTKDVGLGKTVTVSGIALTGLDMGNYALTSNSAVDGADVTKKSLTADVTVANKTYDNTTDATITGYSPVGLVGLETVTINGGTAVFTDSEHVGAGKPVSITGLNLVADPVSANYDFTTTDATTANITQRAITVTAQANSKVYDGLDTSATNAAITSVTVLAAGDTATFTQTYDTTDAGTGLAMSPTATDVVNDGNGGANYLVTYDSANVGTITKAPLTITADDKTKVYGDANPVATATYTGFVAGEDETDLLTDVTLVIVANNQTDVNNHPITAFGATSDNYLITHENGNLEITKRPITVTVTAANKTYDGDTDTTATLAPVGVLFSDVVTASHTGATFDTENVGAGKTVTTAGVTLGGADANNYSVAVSATGTADITALPIAITADAKTKVYGAADPALTYQVTSGALVSGDSFTGALDRAAGEDVGAYAIGQGTLTPGTNYAVSYIPANLTVTQATLNATADDQTKVYGAAVPTLSITYSGFQLGDDAGDLDSAPTAATVASDSSDVGTYAITVSGGGDANYTLTYTDGELSVTPLAITVDVAADNKIYDNNTDAVVVLTPNAAILGDTITAGYTSASFVDENVDTGITVNVSGITLGGADADNYSVAATATGSADITVRPLNVQATSNTKVYGAADPVFAYTSDILSGDTFTGALSRAAGEDVGTYAMTVGTLDAGSNYDTIAFTSANMHITPATLTVTADDKTKTYGTANPALTITYGTFQNGDDENDLDTEPTASTLADTNSNVGDWTITPAGGVSDNYTFNYVNGTLTITKANQTITFGALSDVNFGVADFTVSASSDSLLSVAFAASGACTITGNTVHLTTKGTCTITASQIGDTNWNAASDVVRSFEVLDVTAPVITLNGNATETITSGSVYADAGASASDDVDGDVSGSIVVVNPVNTDTIGTYTITYNVTDSSSNVATEVTRTVEVVARRGGGGFSRPDTTPAPAGRVLGASSYNFQANLTIGSAGNDVIELQKVLIAGGFLKIAAPTGFFGPMTAAAVKLYQASKGINATGFVGPLTRAALNAEGTPTKTVEEQIAELMAKLKLLQAQAGQ